jgi:hypothetical protein
VGLFNARIRKIDKREERNTKHRKIPYNGRFFFDDCLITFWNCFAGFVGNSPLSLQLNFDILRGDGGKRGGELT